MKSWTTGKLLIDCTIVYSPQRRRKRYRILYVWRILEGLVSNVNSEVVSYNHIRHGRKCEIKRIIGKNKICTILEPSFSIQGPKLFNLLPKHFKDLKGVSLDVFKKGLDSFLSQIPDEPQLTGHTVIRKTDSRLTL